jgi:hypothetical protein
MALEKVLAYGKVFVRTRVRLVPDLLRLLVRRPTILAAVGTYETALLVSNRIDGRLKSLAMLKASSLIGCPF